MKKVFSILTVLVMGVAMFGFTAFAGNGNGGGNGGGDGKNALEILAVSVEGTDLDGAEVAADGVISIIFSRGMTDNADANSEKIYISNAADCTVETTVEMGTDKSEMTVTYTGLEAGEYTLVIGGEVAANNGNTLGEDVKVTFTVGGEAEQTPAETENVPTETEEPTEETETAAAPAEKSSAMPIAVAVVAVVVIAGAVVVMKKKK